MPFKSLEEYITFAVSRGDPMKWVDYKTGRADKATAQANTDRDFELRKKESESNSEYRRRTLEIQGAQEARAGALHKIIMEDAKIPPAVKLQATTLAKQMEGIGNALNKAIELASRIATNAPLTNFALMHALPRIAEQPADHGLFTEALIASIAQAAPEAKARVRAFLEGKAPKVQKG